MAVYDLGTCKRCGGRVVNDDSYQKGIQKVNAARCIKCGEMYYEGFPKREGGTTAVCTRCGKLIKVRRRKQGAPKHDPVLCKKCSGPDAVRKCIICGRVIVKGMTCTRRACRSRVKTPTVQISL